MAVTSTQSSHHVRNTAVGRYLQTGTAAAYAITCGFKPRFVCVQNVTSGDKMEWYEGMADASAIKTVAAGTRTIITTLGITVSTSGFTVGLDTDVNVTSEQVSWLAQG